MPRGGARPGAGRPRKSAAAAPASTASIGPDAPVDSGEVDPTLSPLEYMLQVMRDPGVETSRRDRMAQAAAPYVHGRVELGKKDQKQDRAKESARGRFAPASPPKLVAVNGKR